MSTQNLKSTFIDVLERLESLMTLKGDFMRSRAYQKAKESIILCDRDITCANDVADLPKIGKTIVKKLNYYMEHGTLELFEDAKKNPLYVFANVYGIGGKKAKQLVAQYNITTIAELRERQHEVLNDVQRKGLAYYEDILKRIPREEIKIHEQILNKVFRTVKNEGSTFDIVGSYRRGKKTSGDIDVIISDPKNDSYVFDSFIEKLIEQNYLVEVLSKGKVKSLCICQLPTLPARRIDFMFTPKEELPFALLYFTGSKEFNTVMRKRALDMGYTMNEHGFSKMSGKNKLNKLKKVFDSERAVCNFLNIEYKEPTQRIDGTSVVITTNKSDTESMGKISNGFPVVAMLKKFKKDGTPLLAKLGEPVLEAMLKKANEHYYILNKPLLTDSQYDVMREYVMEKFPSNSYASEGHANTSIDGLKNKAKLPCFMPSMDKIKPDTTALTNWLKKYEGNNVLSCKLDGISALYCSPTTSCSESKLYTRGNGSVGQDISHIIDYLRLPLRSNLIIRGELIMRKDVFKAKYSKYFKNIRNLVAGLMNRKKLSIDLISDMDFVAYEVIQPVLKPSKQMKLLSELDIISVYNWNSENLTNEYLSECLIKLRKEYAYEIDGVIVVNDAIYKRKNKNPKHGFAFKMVLSEQSAEAKVVAVHWKPSKDGYLKPRIEIEPVMIGGAKITYVTGHNAAFIVNNNINVGAIIKLIRSGDVIPKVVDVIEQSESPNLPNENLSYKWNKTKIDFILNDKDSNLNVRKQKIIIFFSTLGVVGLGEGNVNRLIKADFADITTILKMTKDDFMMVEGFKEKMATKVHNSIHTILNNISLHELMSATNIFGRTMGSRRIKEILTAYPTILVSKDSDEEKINKISSLNGFGQKTAKMFVPYINEFLAFAIKANLQHKIEDFIKNALQKNETNEQLQFSNKKFIFTGFRSKDIKKYIENNGGKMSTSVSKNVDFVIVKDINDDSSKIKKAKELGLNIIALNDFVKNYVKK